MSTPEISLAFRRFETNRPGLSWRDSFVARKDTSGFLCWDAPSSDKTVETFGSRCLWVFAWGIILPYFLTGAGFGSCTVWEPVQINQGCGIPSLYGGLVLKQTYGMKCYGTSDWFRAGLVQLTQDILELPPPAGLFSLQSSLEREFNPVLSVPFRATFPPFMEVHRGVLEDDFPFGEAPCPLPLLERGWLTLMNSSNPRRCVSH